MSEHCPVTLIAVAIAMGAGFLIGATAVLHDLGESRDQLKALRSEAIALGYARHNPETGEWEWIDTTRE